MKSILIVEDTLEINEIWREVFEDEGYRTSSAYDGEEAMRLLAEESFELVILDLMLPG
ncbi:MAG: DNA-binding response regulator, partial [Thermoplasmata archaeon]